MTQLVDRVWQVERLKAKKSRANKNKRKERVAYVDIDDNDQVSDVEISGIDDNKVNVAKLK